jgi:Ca2+:H+ antiporter
VVLYSSRVIFNGWDYRIVWRIETMSRWLYLLLLATPAGIVAELLQAPSLVIFLLASIALIPLAGLIGLSTEALAIHMGPRIGGLLNATFGNAAEIIIGLAALAGGLPEVVRASLAGSIIGNVLLVLGTALLVGGWRHRRQVFDARVAGQYASMLVLVVIAIAIPSLLATVGEGTRPGADVIRGSQLHQLSIGISIILLFCYAAYIAYSVFGLRAAPESLRPTTGALHESGDAHSHPAQKSSAQSHTNGLLARISTRWYASVWFPLIVLAGVTAVTAIMSELLVGTIEPVGHQIGLSPFFVGLIVIPLVGNAAEHFSAVTAAHRDRMEISMAITAGSSIQIALLAAPILVLAGAILGHPLDLNFSLLEVALFALAAGLYAVISLDGESTWLEGLLLLAFYLILGVGTFFTPTSA